MTRNHAHHIGSAARCVIIKYALIEEFQLSQQYERIEQTRFEPILPEVRVVTLPEAFYIGPSTSTSSSTRNWAMIGTTHFSAATITL